MRRIQEEHSGSEVTQQERMRLLSDHLGMSFRKISEEAGLSSPQGFYDIKAGKCGISRTFANQICARFPEINYDWLLRGYGNMISEDKVVDNGRLIEENKRLREQVESLVKMNESLAETNRMLTQMILGEFSDENKISKTH